MIPLSDDNPTEKVPAVTVLLILVNCLVFGYEFSLMMESREAIDQFFKQWGFIPGKMLWSFDPGYSITLFTSMFLHGGWLHLAGNMLYLWVFGDNVEDELGHLNFLLFYLVAGLAGNIGQYAVNPTSTTPLVGASGAIAGILGSYMILYPTARILTALILVFFVRLVYLPAWILLGFWFFLQLFQGTASLGTPTGGGVAWFAHLGGFLAGGLMIFLYRARQITNS